MSFDKDYPNRKDWRKKYYSKAKSVDRTCRNHGSCPYCKAAREYKKRKPVQMMRQEDIDYE